MKTQNFTTAADFQNAKFAANTDEDFSVNVNGKEFDFRVTQEDAKINADGVKIRSSYDYHYNGKSYKKSEFFAAVGLEYTKKAYTIKPNLGWAIVPEEDKPAKVKELKNSYTLAIEKFTKSFENLKELLKPLQIDLITPTLPNVDEVEDIDNKLSLYIDSENKVATEALKEAQRVETLKVQKSKSKTALIAEAEAAAKIAKEANEALLQKLAAMEAEVAALKAKK